MTEIAEIMDRLRRLRGSPELWLTQENAVSRFIAATPDTTRIFCRGEVQTAARHYPAVLLLDERKGSVEAWAPSGPADAMAEHLASVFYATVPHAAIAREVLDAVDTVVQVQA